MKSVRFEYISTKEFAAIKKINMVSIVEELSALNHPKIKYRPGTSKDGKTFVLLYYENETAYQVLQDL